MTGLSDRSARLGLAVLALALLLADSPALEAAESGFSGLHVQGMSLEIADTIGRETADGVLVRDLALGGPADIAGIKRGDLILEYAGRAIKEFDDLVKAAGSTRPGKSVEVTLLRDGKQMTFSMTPGQWTEPWRLTKSAVASLPALGLTLATLTNKLRKGFGVRWGSLGVVVTLVDPDRSDIGLRRGDLITHVNLEEVWLPSQVIAKHDAAKKAGRKQLLLLIERVNGFHYMLIPVR